MAGGPCGPTTRPRRSYGFPGAYRAREGEGGAKDAPPLSETLTFSPAPIRITITFEAETGLSRPGNGPSPGNFPA